MIRSRIMRLMTRRRPFRAVITELANRPEERDHLLRPNGEVNASAFARAIGVTQASISRALNNPEHQPKKDTIDRVCKTFRISAAQARGEDAMAETTSESEHFSARTRRFAVQFETLLPAQKSALEGVLSTFGKPTDTKKLG